MNLKESKTRENLMRAFAGESQARNRYTFSAEEARKQKMQAIAEVFLYTANQEKEHGEIFYQLLNELAGETIFIDGGYPVDLSTDLITLLRGAHHNEFEEYDDVYPNFANIAEEEGFTSIANTFRLIAEIEKTHGDRFLRFADLIQQNKLYESDEETEWVCLNCGHVHKGKKAPEICPVCKHDRGFFLPKSLSPFEK